MKKSKYMEHYIQAIPHMKVMFAEYAMKMTGYPIAKRRQMIYEYNKSLNTIQAEYEGKHAKIKP